MTATPVSPADDPTAPAPARRTTPRMRVQKEVRFAVVLYGGASLAIYINGVVQEMFHLVRATAPDPDDPGHALLSEEELSSTERAYRHLGQTLDASGSGMTAEYDPLADIRTRFIIDIVSGTSAGGINGVFLAKALTIGAAKAMQTLHGMWLNEGDFQTLINDHKSVYRLTGLSQQRPPESLLNSQRMYRKLLEALDSMDGSASVRRPLVDELDLFVTTTDVRGLPIFLRLGDELASESRYRNVHRFRYARTRAADPADDFVPERNPILAFAARCTSSFPVAFEPMRLSDIDDVLASMPGHRARAGEGSDPQRWKDFFPDYRPPSSEEQRLPTTAYDFTKRAFADGGYLDNKPFSYATDRLSRRHGGFPADRKLIYVEPSPSHPEDQQVDFTKPDAFQNLSAALFLPRQETIREDLYRVLSRNRLINRVERILAGMERDVATDRLGEKAKKENLQRDPYFGDYDLEVMIQKFGVGYGSYHRLKIAALTDHISGVMTRLARFDPDSDEFFAIRYLVRAWREAHYATYKAADDRRQTENQFLLEFDLDYRLRRLDFVYNKIDRLSCLDDAARAMLKAQGIDLPADREEELQRILKGVTERLAPVYAALRQTLETLSSHLPEAQLAEVVRPLEGLRSNAAPPSRAADAPDAPPNAAPNAVVAAMAMIPVPRRELHALLKKATNIQREAYADVIMDRYRDGFEALALALSSRIAAATRPASAICAEVFAPSSPDSGSFARQVTTLLGDYYRNYDRYDLLSYPILYSTEVGDEVDPVEVIRVSPEDAKSLINERDGGENRRKLAGTELMHFGAFLDRSWRENDILWGRLDGAERLIAAVTQGSPLPDELRATVLERAQVAIFADQRSADTIEKTCDLLADAMVNAQSGPDAGRIRQLVASPPGTTGNPVVRDALLAAAEPARMREYYHAAYEVDRAVNPLTALRAMSRASRVFGQMLEGIADRRGDGAAPAAWLTRVSSIFWRLVEVAVPHSFNARVFRYWVGLVYVFAGLMIAAGTIFVEPAVQRLGIVVLGLTIAVHLVVLSLRDVIRGRRRWVRGVLTLAAIGLLVLAGIGAAHASETWDALATWVRARF